MRDPVGKSQKATSGVRSGRGDLCTGYQRLEDGDQGYDDDEEGCATTDTDRNPLSPDRVEQFARQPSETRGYAKAEPDTNRSKQGDIGSKGRRA